MACIPVAISRIWPKNFKRLYIKNKRLSTEFLLHIWKLEEVQTILLKKMSLLASVFMKLLMAKNVVT